MSAFRISQITDIHITFKKDKTIDGIDVISNFERILEKILKYQPDLLVLSGDLCFAKNDKKIYPFVKKRLDATDLPYVVMAGNHDKTEPLAKAFSYKTTPKGDLYYIKDIEDYRLLFVDSSRHKISNDQLNRLEKDLKTGLKPVLFIHHPPAIAGVPFMDRKYPLQNMDQLQDILAKYNGRIPVFCGHYHHEKVLQKGNLDIYMTPSTYFQISDESIHFKAASKLAGWRNITLTDKVDTEVLYL
ncbi:MAG: metallophosphoesterase [Spirochaetaceae bacterium]|jgi:Icc protein|nr:metallophosphoesterase [Spirochaetaceae bacterium]